MVLAVLTALLVVAPLALAARYPLLGWRLGWLGMLLVPLAGVAWWGSWPWDPVQILLLPVVFCAAGARHQRQTLWWMWAITLVPWWLRAASGPPGIVVGAPSWRWPVRRSGPSSSRPGGQCWKNERASPANCTTSSPTTCP